MQSDERFMQKVLYHQFTFCPAYRSLPFYGSVSPHEVAPFIYLTKPAYNDAL